ncbi:hypothetical protein CEXT_357261 [Caerostris extrusa]|uniref:Uncharacterized protein n=1 Tax=Caerostris extrusa TaxID=172846 RepID=A0AAV4SUW8_CAEEX|nr:hypothetical protein CEXT_357261 [Caerostris extrusa]
MLENNRTRKITKLELGTIEEVRHDNHCDKTSQTVPSVLTARGFSQKAEPANNKKSRGRENSLALEKTMDEKRGNKPANGSHLIVCGKNRLPSPRRL